MGPEQTERLKKAVKIALIPVMGGLVVKANRREGGLVGYAYNFRDSGMGRFMVGVIQEGLKDGRDRIRVAGKFIPGISGEIIPDDFDVEIDDEEYPEEGVDELIRAFPEDGAASTPLQEA